MPYFYKSNIKDNFDSLLILPEENPKKELESIKICDGSVEGNNITEGRRLHVSPKLKPYFYAILWSENIIVIASFLFCLYASGITLYVDFVTRNGKFDCNGNIIPQKFLDPCNATNVISLNEVNGIKGKINAIDAEKHSISDFIRYNISVYTNEILEEKLKNLTADSGILKKQLNVQKEVRYICYKQNLEKNCEERSFSKIWEKVSPIFIIYIHIEIILFVLSSCCIWKTKKMESSTDEKMILEKIMIKNLRGIFYIHIFLIVYLIYLWSFRSCNIENDLDKFCM